MTRFDIALTRRYNGLGGGVIFHKKPPIKAFKHVHSDYADKFRTGESIQIATYEHYRQGEGDRVDPLEGISVNRSDTGNIFREAKFGNPDAIRFIDSIIGEGWKKVETTNLIMQNNTLRTILEPSYIFCASTSPDTSRLEAGERCFMIHDLMEFAYQLARVRPDCLVGFQIAPVSYELRDVDVLRDGFRETSPFLKSSIFQPENEIRIVFKPGPILENPLRLCVPFIPRIATEIFGEFVDIGDKQYVKAFSQY